MEQPILRRLLNETAGRKDRGIVCLIGPPQEGKTESIQAWSRDEGRILIRLLAQTMEPETIMGYDVKHPTSGELIGAMPSWARMIFKEPKKKYTLFLDELDKSREATLSSILTLLCDRVIQNQILPDTVAICCAMNVPRAPLPDPLVARLLFVPFPTAHDLERGMGDFGMLKSIAREYLEAPKIAFPDRKKNRGLVFRLKSWTMCEDFWRDDEFRASVILGLVPVKDIPWWTTRLDPKAFRGVDLEEWARSARPQDILDNLIEVLNSDKDITKREAILKILCERANNDPTQELQKILIQVGNRMHEVE